jgi:hypothetical protein
VWRGCCRSNISVSRPFRLAVPQWFDHGSVSTPRSSNRTCRFPASGLYGAFFVKGSERHYLSSFLHAILWFDPLCEHSSALAANPSGRRANLNLHSSSPSRTLTVASTAASCRRSGRRSAYDHPRGARLGRTTSARAELVFGWTHLDPDHEAVIRFCGRAPRRRVHSFRGIAARAGFGLPPPRIVVDRYHPEGVTGIETVGAVVKT